MKDYFFWLKLQLSVLLKKKTILKVGNHTFIRGIYIPRGHILCFERQINSNDGMHIIGGKDVEVGAISGGLIP